MKILRYVIKTDTGLAPNPFWGCCTLALCTPNHQNIRLEKGDWIMANSQVTDGQRLVYAMRVDKIIDLDRYFRNPEFEKKKPKPFGTAAEQCGDNFYYLEENEWHRLPSNFHNDARAFQKDVGKPGRKRPVFISWHFFYFGKKRIALPPKFESLIWGSQGCAKMKTGVEAQFIEWLEQRFSPGKHDDPMDLEDRSGHKGSFVTSLSDAKKLQPAQTMRGSTRTRC